MSGIRAEDRERSRGQKRDGRERGFFAGFRSVFFFFFCGRYGSARGRSRSAAAADTRDRVLVGFGRIDVGRLAAVAYYWSGNAIAYPREPRKADLSPSLTRCPVRGASPPPRVFAAGRRRGARDRPTSVRPPPKVWRIRRRPGSRGRVSPGTAPSLQRPPTVVLEIIYDFCVFHSSRCERRVTVGLGFDRL